MLNIDRIDESDLNEELLLESGYEFQNFEFRMLSPEESRKARNRDGVFNRNCSRTSSFEELVEELERNSTVVKRYDRKDFRQEQNEKLAKAIAKLYREFETSENIDHPSELDEYIEAEEDAYQPSDEAEFPERVFFPCPIELDASGILEFEFIEDRIKDHGYEINEVLITASPDLIFSEDVEELNRNLNYTNIEVSFGDQDLFSHPPINDQSSVMPSFTYLNSPRDSIWMAPDIKDYDLGAEVVEGLEERGYEFDRSYEENPESKSFEDLF